MAGISQKTLEKIMSSQEIFISHPEGKMHDIPTITESCKCNAFCKKMGACSAAVCSKCYAQNSLAFEKAAAARYERNTQLLSGGIITEHLLPRVYSDIARFESHGDWVNEYSAMNEIAIANFNPKTHFTVWTKRVDILRKLCKTGVLQPKNLHVMLSSPFVGKSLPHSLKLWFADRGWTVSFFTVVSLDDLRKNHTDDELRERGHEIITCGGRDCRSCMKCYGDHPHEDVVELLKQDVYKAKKLGMRYNKE